MKQDASGIVTRLLDNRKVLVELVIAAILLSLSVNLISSSIMELKWISPLWAFVLASLLAVMCGIYFVVKLLWYRTHTHNFRGFIILDSKKNAIVDIPRYDYGRDLHKYMQAAFAENMAIKKMWDKEPVDKDFCYEKENSRISYTKGKGHHLVSEATEYYVLENLSTHLTDYFNRPDFDDHNLHTFARNDIPDVLLSNRFLELFSKPMEDRTVFSADDGDFPHGGEVVMAMGEGGAFYSRFDLTLPKGARVSRSKSNSIIIDTSRFTLAVDVDFGGFGALIPYEYEQHILGIDPRNCHDYQISVKFTVSFKFASLFLPGGWGYYRWIESFMESFNSKFSEDRHFTDIGWESALTLIEYNEKEKSSPEEKRSQPDAVSDGESAAASSMPVS